MGRRIQDDDAGMNLDSLMDALTNVVAVLILVLVLVQADATQKVVTYFESLEPASAEDVAESLKQVEQLEQNKRETEALLEAEAPDPDRVKKAREEILRMSTQVSSEETKRVALEALRELEEKVRKERDEEKKETEDLQQEIAMLESSLDQTPVLQSLAPAEVSIPDSKPIPDDAEIYYILVRGGRVHFVDTVSPLDEFLKIVRANKSKWRLEKIKRQGEDLVIYDQTKIVEAFKGHRFTNNQGHRIVVPPNPTHVHLYMDIYPDLEKGGTPAEMLNRRRTAFYERLQRLAVNRKAVIMFRVNPNDFPTYLKARRIVDSLRMPAGWEVFGDSKIRTWITDVTVKRLKEPPPPDPNAKRPPAPPGLKPTLD